MKRKKLGNFKQKKQCVNMVVGIGLDGILKKFQFLMDLMFFVSFQG